MIERVLHPLEPVADAGSRVLLLGTMPSPKSREAGFYYAHPQNRFWRVLAALWGEETPAGTQERLAFARRHHIALWDVLRACSIEGADDGSIRQPEVNDLRQVLERADIRAIFTTGAKAAALYKRHCRVTLDGLTEAYRAILAYI